MASPAKAGPLGTTGGAGGCMVMVCVLLVAPPHPNPSPTRGEGLWSTGFAFLRPLSPLYVQWGRGTG